MDIISETAWEKVFEEIAVTKGTAIIIGATDSGKSTLAKYFIRRLLSEQIRVSLIDSDVGQSSLGLPGTISMKPFFSGKDLEDFTFEKMSFIGTINPAKKIPFIIDTVKRITAICQVVSDITLIDTSGLVDGETGEALKVGKIRAVKPEHTIAVQRRDELEHILTLIENRRVHRVTRSEYAKTRTVAVRTAYRKKKFDAYFRRSEMHDFIVYSRETSFFYNNKLFIPRETMFKKGTVIGLNHDENTVALGILDEITDTSVTFRSPIGSLRKINRVVFGDMTM
jgi:polynucleotide 5'-hydroxyl-kinase GRC3/NOL9